MDNVGFDWAGADPEFMECLKRMEQLRKRREYYLAQLKTIDDSINAVGAEITRLMKL